MRVAKKEIRTKAEIEDLLAKCHVGRLGTIGKDGFPMVKPLNYIYLGGRIYFHSAKGGEKIDDIEKDNRVCFEADVPIAYVASTEHPCKAAYRYRSVIAKGRAFIVQNSDEKLRILAALMEKYQPEGGYGPFLPEKVALTAIVKIDIHELTGKADL